MVRRSTAELRTRVWVSGEEIGRGREGGAREKGAQVARGLLILAGASVGRGRVERVAGRGSTSPWVATAGGERDDREGFVENPLKTSLVFANRSFFLYFLFIK